MSFDALYAFGLKLTPRFLRPLVEKLGVDFLRFGCVGAAGFAVDLIALTVLVRMHIFHDAHLGSLVLTPQMLARFVSFPIAVAATWALNRSWTFRAAPARALHHEVLSYVAVQFAGGAANLGAYNAALILAPGLRDVLILPLAVGSAVGLCLTFIGSKYWAFRSPDS